MKKGQYPGVLVYRNKYRDYKVFCFDPIYACDTDIIFSPLMAVLLQAEVTLRCSGECCI